MSTSRLIEFLFVIPCVLIALSVHEVAHGWIAYKLGDPTAKSMGRLTLNPLKHLDPIGTLCMIFFHFGWARPVPINTRYFKNNKRDTALTAAAGPISNFIMAFAGVLLRSVFSLIYIHHLPNDITQLTPRFFSLPAPDFLSKIIIGLIFMAEQFCILNLSLGVFNLIPIPPLDGSRIFLVWLPPKYYFGVMQYERYIQLGLLILLWTNLLTFPLGKAVNAIYTGMNWLVNLVIPA